MNKKLLVIGAGINQLPIIKTAKNLGYYVIAVSCKGDYPGFKVADEKLYIDIFDIESIYNYAKNNGINGIITDQSDMATPIVAQLAERLNLPTYGYKNSLYFTDKTMMRELFEKLGFPIPAYKQVNNIEEAKKYAKRIGYPVIIKPTDAFASKGVFKLFDENDLINFFSKSIDCSRAGNVVIEKLINGSQYFCQGFVEKTKLRLFAFSDRYYFDLPYQAIPYTNAFPAKISNELKNRMELMFNKIINHLKPEFGQVWAEWIYDDKNDILYIVEIAIRGAGAFVTSYIIPAAYGVDTQPYLVNAAMGDYTKSFFDEKIEEKASAFYCFLLPPGKVVEIKGLDSLSSIKGVVETNIKNLKIGEEIPPILNKTSRFGPIIIKGQNRDELDEILKEIKTTLTIKVKTEKGIEGIIWT